MSIGYPDFGRKVQTQDSALYSIAENVQGETLYAIQYCGDTPYIEIQWDTTGLSDNYLIQLSFSDDDAGNVFAGSSSVVTIALRTGWISFKAKGQYVQLIIDNPASTDTAPIVVTARTSLWPAGPYDASSLAAPILLFNGGVAAGGNHIQTAVTVIGGPATLFLHHATNNSWHANIEYWDWASGSWLTFGQWDGTTFNTGGSFPIQLPAAPIRVSLTNSDTSGRSMIASITT